MKRWIIRCLFILPILLCGTGWTWSASHGPYLVFSHAGIVAGVGTAYGGVGMGVEPETLGWWQRMPGPSGLDYGQYRMDEVHFWPMANQPDFFLGFRLHHASGPGATGWEANIPYWFLLLAFSILLYIVWRKTRPRPKRGAFPVEEMQHA